MGYNALEIELRELLAGLQRWREQGGVPAIERGVALSRLQQVYTEIQRLPVQDTPAETPAQATVAEDTSARGFADVEVVAEEAVDIEAEKEEASEKAEKPEKESRPTILGVPVSAYARQEIVANLFHRNLPLFDQEIARFERMQSLDEALLYIGETFHWVPEEAATIKFIDILETHFRER